MCNKEFKLEQVQRHVAVANAGSKIAASGSADRKKMNKKGNSERGGWSGGGTSDAMSAGEEAAKKNKM